MKQNKAKQNNRRWSPSTPFTAHQKVKRGATNGQRSCVIAWARMPCKKQKSCSTVVLARFILFIAHVQLP